MLPTPSSPRRKTVATRCFAQRPQVTATAVIMALIVAPILTLVLGYGFALGVARFLPAEAYPQAVRRDCKYDYKRLCPHYDVNSAKMRACMRSKVGEISPRCYDTLIRYGYGKKGRSR